MKEIELIPISGVAYFVVSRTGVVSEILDFSYLDSNKAYNDFRNNINTNGGKKVAIEEFEPTLFQTSWISGYAGGYRKYGVHDIPPVDILLRKTSSNPDRQWLALFRRNRRWYAVLNRIPVSKNPCTLKSLIRDMKNVFYPSHPAGHYPFL